MFRKKLLLLATSTVAATILLAATQIARPDSPSQAIRLEGAWIAKVPGTPLLWTYNMSPDPSGRSASISGSIPVPLQPATVVPGLFSDLEYISPMVGQIVMTSRNTASFTAVWYGLKKGSLLDQVVFIGVTSGQIEFTAPGKAKVTHSLGYYDPNTDIDGDGLPDSGQAPALCLPAVSFDTRLPLLAPCSP